MSGGSPTMFFSSSDVDVFLLMLVEEKLETTSLGSL